MIMIILLSLLEMKYRLVMKVNLSRFISSQVSALISSSESDQSMNLDS